MAGVEQFIKKTMTIKKISALLVGLTCQARKLVQLRDSSDTPPHIMDSMENLLNEKPEIKETLADLADPDFIDKSDFDVEALERDGNEADDESQSTSE